MMRKILSDGVETAFEVEGRGTPLVLLHGFSDTRAFWRDQGYVDAFLATGRQPVLIDARGHGESGKPHEPELYTLRRRARDVVAVLDALGIDTAEVLGYSLGGWTALGLACHFPDRVRAVVAGGAHPYAESLRGLRDALAAGLDAWIGVVEGMAGPLPATVRERLRRNDVEALAAGVARDRPDISPLLAESPVPLLLYAGEADPRHAPAKRFARETGASFVGLPGLNHMQALFATESVARAAAAFFDRHARRRRAVPPREHAARYSRAQEPAFAA